VTYENRPENTELAAEPHHIVCERCDVVTDFRLIALATTPEIDCSYLVGRFEMFVLRLKERVITAPTVDEHERRIACAVLPVEELHSITIAVRHWTLL
jgi:hypothetical protein